MMARKPMSARNVPSFMGRLPGCAVEPANASAKRGQKEPAQRRRHGGQCARLAPGGAGRGPRHAATMAAGAYARQGSRNNNMIRNFHVLYVGQIELDNI